MAPIAIDIDAEQAEFEKEVANIVACQLYTQLLTRVDHTPREESPLWGTPKEKYASSRQALKLWGQMQERLDKGTYELTFGATDPIVIAKMAKYQQTVYVSGYRCGFTQVFELGMDQADYPWDTIPKVVEKIHHSQMWNDRRQHQIWMSKTKEWDEEIYYQAGRTIAPTSEYIEGLTVVRMQFDIMGAETMLLMRTDLIKAQFMTSVMDPRDQEYIIGATEAVEPLTAVLARAIEGGELSLKDLVRLGNGWEKAAGLMTFDEAVKEQAAKEQYKVYETMIPFPTALPKRREAAKKRRPIQILLLQEKFTPLSEPSIPVDSDIKGFPLEMAKQGAVFQIKPTWCVQGIRHYADQRAKMFKEGGMAGRSGLEDSGAYLTDAFFETIVAQDGVSEDTASCRFAAFGTDAREIFHILRHGGGLRYRVSNNGKHMGRVEATWEIHNSRPEYHRRRNHSVVVVELHCRYSCRAATPEGKKQRGLQKRQERCLGSLCFYSASDFVNDYIGDGRMCFHSLHLVH
ncbi:Phosphoenolpyruvate/pyruvate domain-containing protein [Acephala macrosclerotiorum]|nr:Phosphoenolpyruvate/pyruvate domain-containing protein [Acephala macrosclerotiorum]